MRQRKTICATCDAWCGVLAEVDDDGRVRVKARDPRPLHADICMKGVHAPTGFATPTACCTRCGASASAARASGSG